MEENSERRRIVILAHYCGALDGSYSNRFVYLSDLLCDRNEIELITSDFHHSTKTKKQVTGNYPFKITLLPEIGYTKNIGFKRLISHWLFAQKVRNFLGKKEDIDLIYVSFPSISIAKIATEFAREHEVPIIVDVQDLWPEAFHKQLLSNFVGAYIYRFLARRTNQIFSSANKVVAVSETFISELSKRANLKSAFATYIGAFWEHPVKEEAIHKRGSKTIDIVYLGSLGDSYDLKLTIDSFFRAKSILNDKIPILLTIIGDGESRLALEEYAESKGVGVCFLGLVPHHEVQRILPMMHIAINPIVPWSVASIINKHADYAMAGLPVINTQKSKEYRELLDTYKCGVNVDHDLEQVTKAIIELALNRDKREKMSMEALRMAHDKFNRKYTYAALAAEVEYIMT